MGNDNQDHREREKPKLVFMPSLLGQQEDHTPGEKQPGPETVVMFAETMPERPGANDKGQADHPVLKTGIIDNIDAEDRQAGYHQRQNGAMNGAKHRSSYAQGIPVYFVSHKKKQNYNKRNDVANKIVLSLHPGCLPPAGAPVIL